MVFWQDVPIEIHTKCIHIKRIGGKIYNSFIKDYGDIPIGRINEITKKFEPCVNARGLAYAKRNDVKYRKNKHEDWRRNNDRDY